MTPRGRNKIWHPEQHSATLRDIEPIKNWGKASQGKGILKTQRIR
jgi:hypothetical protein